MRGIVRPCRRHLGPELHARWQAHLCGLCLTLRDEVGQSARTLTGYDVLLLSVLVEAQAGSVETTQAGPCALRGFSGATVVTAAAGLSDKLHDGDLPAAVRPSARRVATRLGRSGTALAAAVGLDPAPVLAASAASAAAERAASPSLLALLDPTGEAVAALFAHTAVVAGVPANRPALADAGRAFGRLVHLLDAVDDRASDLAADRFNPLTATGTDDEQARELAEALVGDVRRALDRVAMVDPALVEVLLGTELKAAVHRTLPPRPAVPAQRAAATGVLAPLMALWVLLLNAVFIGGTWGGGRRPRRYRGYPPPGYGAYGPPGGGYGYRRVGPSCGQLLACNCCANLACNACCCGGQCANG